MDDFSSGRKKKVFGEVEGFNISLEKLEHIYDNSKWDLY